MNCTICTLYEGDYHLGVAALLQSLHRQGFAGTFVCGYRGPLPPWHHAADRLAPIRLRWVPVDTAIHFTNHKPAFLRECLAVHTPDADAVIYIDPDIVVRVGWPVLDRWVSDGVALCEDVNHYLPARHPFRLAWQDFFARSGLPVVRPLDRYYNAGFVGLPRNASGLLDAWIRLMELAKTEIGDLDRLKRGSPSDLFYSMDQDALNMALMLGDWPLNTAGPEAMGFRPGALLVPHAVGRAKPWRKSFLRHALQGRSPTAADRAFWAAIEGPLDAVPLHRIRRQRRLIAVAAALGRVWQRR